MSARYLLVTDPTIEISSPERFFWRLISSNNRELGRSAHMYERVTDCCASVAALRQDVRRGQVLTSYSDGGWRWTLSVGGRALATSGRSYQRPRECEYNYQQFVAAVETADSIARSHRPRQRAGQARAHGDGVRHHARAGRA